MINIRKYALKVRSFINSYGIDIQENEVGDTVIQNIGKHRLIIKTSSSTILINEDGIIKIGLREGE